MPFECKKSFLTVCAPFVYWPALRILYDSPERKKSAESLPEAPVSDLNERKETIPSLIDFTHRHGYKRP